MARSQTIDRCEVFGYMVKLGLGPRPTARHFNIAEGTLCSLTSREKLENPFPEGDARRWGGLNGWKVVLKRCPCDDCIKRDAERSARRKSPRAAK